MSGCNQDGKENTPITAPSGKQQIELMERLYTLHGISPADIQYIESHGKVESLTVNFFAIKQEGLDDGALISVFFNFL